MKINKICFTFMVLLLGVYASAQQSTSSVKKTINNQDNLIGKVNSLEVYLYSENDLMQYDSDTVIWYSNPEYVLFIKENDSVNSYSFTSELSLAVYELLARTKKYGEEKNLCEIMKIILELAERKEDINEIKYEQVDNNRYGYWIYYWFKYYVQHKHESIFCVNQNIQYSPVSILHLTPLKTQSLWNKKAEKWQHVTYGEKSRGFNIYSLKNSDHPNGCFLLESLFDNNITCYDLILKCEGEYSFYLPMGSFSALVNEFGKLYEVRDFLDIVRILCLIDMFYK